MFRVTQTFGEGFKQTPNCFELLVENSKKRLAKSLDYFLRPLNVLNITITVLIESFQELIICTAVSMGMFEIRDYWTTSDKVSVTL